MTEKDEAFFWIYGKKVLSIKVYPVPKKENHTEQFVSLFRKCWELQKNDCPS